jgi:hypothetical protein
MTMEIKLVGTHGELEMALTYLEGMFTVVSQDETTEAPDPGKQMVCLEVTVPCPLCSRPGGFCGGFGECQYRDTKED